MAFRSKATASVGLVGSPSTVSDTVVSGATHTVIGLSFANVSASPVNISARLNKSGGASVFLIRDAAIPVGSTLVVVGGDQKLVLETGDTVTAHAGAAASVDAVLSYLV